MTDTHERASRGHRIDIVTESRHVEVRVDGVVVADTHQPRVLSETGLPPRYYLPSSDVRMDLLRPIDKITHCPYKGEATYWDVVVDGTVHEALAWSYRAPIPESEQIAGLICFYNEKVEVIVDGVAQQQPRTKFS